jgi:hypothetical protein
VAGFILYEVLVGNVPVHFGRGGPLLPGPLLAVGLGGPVVYLIWKNVKLSDFKFPKQRQSISLFGDCDVSSIDNRRSRSEATPDEDIR